MTARPLVCLVTGAGSGFGALIARALARSGHIVYAGFLQERDDNQVSVYRDAASFAEENDCQLRCIHLNVVKDDSINNAVDKIMTDVEKVDVLVHNAGMCRTLAKPDLH